MAQPVKLNFKIYQGSTFGEVLRWESSVKVYKPITAIDKSAPVKITAPEHGLPLDWRFRVTNVSGMKEINSGDTAYSASEVTSDTITINSINSLGYTLYTSGGVVEYNKPIDLTGFTARMQVRPKLDSNIIILSLSTENGGITVDNITKMITLSIPAEITAQLSFTTAVYSLEMVSNGGQVTPFIGGTVSLVKEVTR